MTTAVVLATGPSMTQEIADAVRGRGIVIAINRCFRLAPWADALVAGDRAWWRRNPDALEFAGRKFCAFRYPGTERMNPTMMCPAGTNSGKQGMRIAQEQFSATRILLCGFDLRGNTESGRTNFRGFLRQFKSWHGAEVINCTPGSALKRFPFMELDAALRT
jgi:hypothetical protein